METFETPFRHQFIYGDYGKGSKPKIVDELNMIRVSISIREKVNWSEKIGDPTIAAKWRQEVRGLINNEQFDYVLAELGNWKVLVAANCGINYTILFLSKLGYYLSLKDGSIEVGAVDYTWQSDTLIDDNLRGKLIEGVSVLEIVPDSKKDWHPGSNNQVLDLVHPSLFCFVAGRTRILSKPISDNVRSQFICLSHPSDMMSLTILCRNN